MRIVDVTFSRGYTGFFFDDQRAIKAGAGHDGFIYTGAPITEGFKSVRVPGESVSVMLLLDNGQIAVGDCAAVQYSGAGGRDPLFLGDVYIPFMREHIAPKLIGRELTSFRELAQEFDTMTVDGKRLHTAVRYGLSQALLDAVAKSRNEMMCEVIAREYEQKLDGSLPPIFGQTGDDRYINVDKMLLKETDVLPHALINNMEKIGAQGENLHEYVSWLSRRVREVNPDPNYCPQFHIDCYGMIGIIFKNDYVRMASYLGELEKAAAPYQLYIEGPMDMGERQAQIEALAALRREMEKLGVGTRIVADEWCNTYEDVVAFTEAKCCHMVQIKTPDLGSIHNTAEAVLYCKKHGMEAYQGGTCNETDVSARACVHVAVGVQAERCLAKPGMGFDEGYMVVYNEMRRIKALLGFKK